MRMCTDNNTESRKQLVLLCSSFATFPSRFLKNIDWGGNQLYIQIFVFYGDMEINPSLFLPIP